MSPNTLMEKSSGIHKGVKARLVRALMVTHNLHAYLGTSIHMPHYQITCDW
jgi:hypothetical protein